MNDFEKIIKELTLKNKTIATMESCTGGGVVNEITNHAGASEILKFSAVTYSNEFKIKMGVPKEIVETYTVYSKETAREMSKAISIFTNSDYGIGITGKLKRVDSNNLVGDDSTVYISIYDKETKIFTEENLQVARNTRRENKEDIITEISRMLKEILQIEKVRK